jgi:hypothetical protein
MVGVLSEDVVVDEVTLSDSVVLITDVTDTEYVVL